MVCKLTIADIQPIFKTPETSLELGEDFLRDLLGPHTVHFFPGSEPAGVSAGVRPAMNFRNLVTGPRPFVSQPGSGGLATAGAMAARDSRDLAAPPAPVPFLKEPGPVRAERPGVAPAREVVEAPPPRVTLFIILWRLLSWIFAMIFAGVASVIGALHDQALST